MSKKSKNSSQTRRMAPAGSRTVGKASGSKPVSSKAPNNGRSDAERVVHGHIKAAQPEVNLQAVRITAGVVGVVILAGVIAALVMQKVTVNAAGIIEMVLLGVLVAFALFTAIQPQAVVAWVSRLKKN